MDKLIIFIISFAKYKIDDSKNKNFDNAKLVLIPFLLTIFNHSRGSGK